MASLPYWMQSSFLNLAQQQGDQPTINELSSQGWLSQGGMSSAGYTPPPPGAAGAYGGYTGTDPAKYQTGLFQGARDWLNANPDIWNPYGGQMSAGQTQAQGQATDAVTGLLGYQPQNVTAGSFPGGNLSAYMNPFTQNVIDASLSDIDRSRQIANQQGARSASASTYGGDRNALIEAETNRGYADIAARTSAQLRSQGFDTAAGLMGRDQAMALQADLANQRAGLQGTQLGLGAAGQLFGMGTQQQATDQAALDRQYQEYLRSTYGPMQGYNFLAGLLPGGTPQGSNPGAGFAGGAMAGASIGAGFGGVGAIPGWAIGGLLGGLGGLL